MDRLPHRTPRASDCSPYRLKHSSGDGRKELSLSRAAADQSSDNMSTTVVFSGGRMTMNEKETLHGLNDRFAGFIDKVRHLERQNQLLESEIRDTKERRRSPSSLEEEHGAELAELRRLLRDVAQEKQRVEVEHQSLEEELERLGSRYEREARGRADAERGIAALKRDIGDACQAKDRLDKQAQSLVDDVDFLKKSHEAEVSRMAARVQEAAAAQQVNVGDAHRRHVDFGKADLTAALRDIRAQLEGHATSDLRQADDSFRAQFAKLTEAAESKREALRAGQQEVQECRRNLQAKSVELDCNRGTRDALERQLREVEDRHNEDVLHYQDTIKELENELISAKFDMSAHLREYQDLLNVKMELDVEILSYRKLLEGEETHLSAISGAPVSMPYIYRQSPVYTLPCLGRPGGPGRRAEPQYKFVEEIITETTREIEMSEFEESGSEESAADAGGAEEEGRDDKAERESREEEAAKEAEDNQSDKHSPDGDGEQASDSQQDQVESAQRSSEQGDDDKVEEEIAMDKAEAESQAESTENIDRPTAEISAHSEEVPSTEATGAPEHEPRDSVASVNGQMGSDAAMATPAVQKDTAAKATDSKIEESEEVKMTEPEVDKKVGALKESEESDVKVNIDTTAQAKMLEDESSAKSPTDSGSVQESSIVDKPQAEAPSLPTETVEKSTDLAVAPSVPLPKDTPQPEKQNKETPSVVPRGEEKEDRITESMAARNKADTAKSPIGHEVAKSIEKAADDADKVKDKGASVKSEPPKLDGEKTDSGDKTHAVEPIFPKEKIAVTEENKDTKQGLPDSSKTQEPSSAIDDATDSEKDKLTAAKSDTTEPSKVNGEISISGDKTPTVKPVIPQEKIAVTEKSKDSQLDGGKTQEPPSAINDTGLEKEKCTAAKSDTTEPPKPEGEKPSTGENTQTVDVTFPKEKIALTVETKDPQQGAPDSSKTQKPSNGKVEDEKSDSGDKTHTVEKTAVTEESKDSSKTQEPSNAIDHTDSEKDKCRPATAECNMTEPLKLEGEKSDSGAKTHAVEPILPTEKTAVSSTVEDKDTKQGVTDSSKTQHLSSAATPTVKPVIPQEKIAVTEKSKDSQLDSGKTQEPSSAAIDDASDLEKEKRTVAESDMTEPPKLEGEKSISEDKTQTVEPVFPKEKIAVTEESKDTKQADGSKSQEPASKVPEKINIAKEKEEKLKDSAKDNDSGKTEPIEISEAKTPSQTEPGTSAVSVTAKTAGGLMSEAAKPKTENGFSNGIGGGVKVEDNEPMKSVSQGEAAKEKTNTSI